MVPDLCTVNVDIRLTPALEASAAAALLHTAAADTDEAWPGTPPTGMDIPTRWTACVIAGAREASMVERMEGQRVDLGAAEAERP